MIAVLLGIALCSLLIWLLICNLPKQLKDLRTEVILVTGAGSGLGRLLSVELSKHCDNIIGWDKNLDSLKETAELVFQASKHVDSRNFRSSSEDIRECASKLHMTCGRATIVISNAGIVNGKYLLDLTGEDAERVFKVNFFAAFYASFGDII
ncbi:unnamed protein product [Dibothriocephalus latus]|uniref:Uncharacterized protein n=1 Tax=Dibothriocephalus latus TaxID=60516 RepID=A0A3P6RFR2_DIBLA|nr:unnamed protein product [Dibothriocephalus latus]